MGKKSSMSGLNFTETDIGKQLQESAKQVADATKKIEDDYKLHINKILEMNRKQVAEMKVTDPYSVAIAQIQKEQEALTTEVDNYKDSRNKKLEVEKWYLQEYEKLVQNKKNLSDEDKNNALISLNGLYDQKNIQAEDEVWQERGQKIGNVVGDGLEDILTEFGNFDGSMRKMSKKLYDYLIQESMNALLQQVFGIKKMQSIANMLDLGSKKGGFLGGASSLIKGIGKTFGIFHSGGIVPVGANAELPGTEEQLALLKGGERILSPAENTSYNNGGGGGSSPVVFNNFNVKAWDSKDVQKYLLENKHLINSITYEGIKNNNNQLRNIVRSA